MRNPRILLHQIPLIYNDYSDLFTPRQALDLRVPSNIQTVVEFDPVTRLYTVMQKIGEWTVSEPLILTEEEYTVGKCPLPWSVIGENSTGIPRL